MELRLESRALNEAVEATAQFSRPSGWSPAVVGAATTEDEGFELVLRHKPSLPTCQLLIVLVRETQAVVQEAMQAYADAVIFKSSLGTGKGDFVQALQTLSEGGVYLPEEIRKLGAAEAPNPNLPPLIEELTERALEVVAGVARGLTNQGIGSSLGISVETVKTHVVNAKDKLGAADRTQLAVMALLYGLIDPLG